MPRDDASPSQLHKMDSAFEIEEFEDVTLLLKNPMGPKQSWWSRLTSLFNFRRRRGFERLETEEAPLRPRGTKTACAAVFYFWDLGRWCPEEEAGFFSRYFYTYMNSLIDLGMKKHLAKEDLWDLAGKDETEHVAHKYDKNLERSKDSVTKPQVRHPERSGV